MKAMIFAAGLGTRLRPLTDTCPKALVKINGIPLLEIAIKRLIRYGFAEIIINIHHFGEQVLQFLADNKNFGVTIKISDERARLLETGGALKKARHLLEDEPFLVCNADVLTNMDLKTFYETHCQSNALATLAVRKRKTSRYLQFDDKNILTGWKNVKTAETKTSRVAKTTVDWAFSGIHVIHPDIFDYMPTTQKFSIIDVYLQAAKERIIKAYPHDENIWLDVGKIDSLPQAEKLLPLIKFMPEK